MIQFPKTAPSAPLAGYWMPVLFSPEPAVGERITVGIALRLADGGAKFRWLKTYDRLRRVFGEDAATHLPFLIRHAEALLGRSAEPDTDHLQFGEARELWAADPDRALDELFVRFVPLARAFEADKRPMAAVQNRRLCESVYQHLRTSQNHRAAALVPQNPLLRSSDDPPRYLHVPIQGLGRFATIVSAHAKKLDTIDKNIYPAVAQLNAASKIHRIKSRAVFLLRPDESQFSEAEYDVVDEHLHQTMFVLRNEGVTVIPEISSSLLAESIQEWGLAH